MMLLLLHLFSFYCKREMSLVLILISLKINEVIYLALNIAISRRYLLFIFIIYFKFLI